MRRNNSTPRRIDLHDNLVTAFLSVFPILSAIFVTCFGAVSLVVPLLLADNHYILAGLAGLVLVIILGPVMGALAYRFLARAFPLKASAQRNPVSLRSLRFFLAAMLAVCLALGAWAWNLTSIMINPPRSPGLSGGFTAALESMSASVELSLCAVLLLWSACMIWGVIRVIRLHSHPGDWAADDFVLFLRSFGSVSDSAALGLLVRGAGVHSRVALLASPREVRASWNPLTLAIAGYNLRHPFYAAPIYLESTKDSWADDVRRLVTSARLVVIDISHRSPGLSLELQILHDLKVSGKTLQFEEVPKSSVHTDDSDNISGALRSGAGEDTSGAFRDRLVLVERSLLRRRLSEVLVFTFTYLGFLILTGLVVYPLDPSGSSKIASFVNYAALVYSVVPAIYSAAVLSPKAGFSRRSAAALVRAMRQRSTR